MATTHYSRNKSGAIVTTNNTLSSSVALVQSGSSVGMRDFTQQTVFVDIDNTTSASTVTLQASHDGSTWFTLDSKTYAAAATTNDVFSYNSHLPFMRSAISTLSAAKVIVDITGGN